MMVSKPKALIVNDNEGQANEIREKLLSICDVEVVKSHEELRDNIDKIRQVPELFAIVILDYFFADWPESLTQNPTDGGDVIASIRQGATKFRPHILILSQHLSQIKEKWLKHNYLNIHFRDSRESLDSLRRDVECLLDRDNKH